MVGENSLKYFANLLLKLLTKVNRLMLGYKHLWDLLDKLRWYRDKYCRPYAKHKDDFLYIL